MRKEEEEPKTQSSFRRPSNARFFPFSTRVGSCHCRRWGGEGSGVASLSFPDRLQLAWTFFCGSDSSSVRVPSIGMSVHGGWPIGWLAGCAGQPVGDAEGGKSFFCLFLSPPHVVVVQLAWSSAVGEFSYFPCGKKNYNWLDGWMDGLDFGPFIMEGGRDGGMEGSVLGSP
ncbi:uncharacterized protein K489DRAFT_230997 [Dissoconium aciculare CBS 342.82]|uniref:Uncharacterized protein n=1 Tax=Dissoconium aciculare CBS 342.82 TaxID=1314786 RepID=A0A6J3M206_9PEZI|nr:uncharacterized protein K489DRAFT_230997 [Dissoconium aciculare CBS 342.82]KAF1822041.1 hypothetical protein K489DRAFT_230997 [Dissoconium aciculare CBS 342.82]